MSCCCDYTCNEKVYCRLTPGPRGAQGQTGPLGTGPTGTTGATGTTGPTGPVSIFNYGCFTSQTSQPVSNTNEPTLISYDTTEIASGITYNGNSEIVFSTTGIYKIGASPEFDMTSSNQMKSVLFWFRKNFVDIANSASVQVVADKDSDTYTYVEIIIDITSGDNIQCFFASEEDSMRIAAFDANSFGYTHPAIPSIILTAQQISV